MSRRVPVRYVATVWLAAMTGITVSILVSRGKPTFPRFLARALGTTALVLAALLGLTSRRS